MPVWLIFVSIGVLLAAFRLGKHAERDLTADARGRMASGWAGLRPYARGDFATPEAWRLWLLGRAVLLLWVVSAAIWVWRAD